MIKASCIASFIYNRSWIEDFVEQEKIYIIGAASKSAPPRDHRCRKTFKLLVWFIRLITKVKKGLRPGRWGTQIQGPCSPDPRGYGYC